jgi:hypothetical protein
LVGSVVVAAIPSKFWVKPPPVREVWACRCRIGRKRRRLKMLKIGFIVPLKTEAIQTKSYLNDPFKIHKKSISA